MALAAPRMDGLSRPLSSLKGVGPKIAGYLRVLCGDTVRDLLFHAPVGGVDRRFETDLSSAEHGQIATMTLRVCEHAAPPYSRRKAPYKIYCEHETGEVTLVFFNARASYLTAQLPVGQLRVVSGRLEAYAGAWQMSHPDNIVPLVRKGDIMRVEPVYPLTYGVSRYVMQKIMPQALAEVPRLPEWLGADLLTERSWPSAYDALHQLHQPKTIEVLAADSTARARLAYDEVLAYQLALGLSRERRVQQPGRAMQVAGEYDANLTTSLPFALTEWQVKAGDEIAADMAAPHRMMRLLQGDVGAGKTLVALRAMVNAVEAGLQVAFMAPTELLARQHYKSMQAMLSASPLAGIVTIELLTGKDKSKQKQQVVESIKSNRCAIVVGTHALFQDKVEFANLGFVVIDEQHRFGVNQRLALAEKGEQVDVLLMTATPIPRTLTMTMYGDMDVSILAGKPAGRKPIDTRVMPLAREMDVMQGLARVFERGERAYWVCPLIEPGDDADETEVDASAEARYQILSKIYPNKVGLVHGRMSADDKQAVMQQFADGTLLALVATTVIEVGVDVAQATVMVIESAEKFGLSQLHQLRGRVGRSDLDSSCILLYNNAISESGKARLQVIRDTEDGFKIAEEDLALRGAGEVLGTRQSGLPAFYFLDVSEHHGLMLRALDEAKFCLQHDPELASTRGVKLRLLLRFFGYDDSVRMLKAI